MSHGIEARQVRAVFFPERKRNTFHRINLEYLSSLKAMSRDTVQLLMTHGLQGNLRRAGGSDDVLLSLRPELQLQSIAVHQQGLKLQRERDLLRSQLSTRSRESFSLYRAEVGVDFANQQLSESLALRTPQARDRILSAEHVLKEALSVDHSNYRAHFELGWTYLFLLDAAELAEFHLNCAARLAREDGNRPFAAFAQRHLADACYGRGNYEQALSHAVDVLSLSETGDAEPEYEYARYLAAAGQVTAATHQLAGIVTDSSLHYVQAQLDPMFREHDEIAAMLYDLRDLRVKRIRHYVHTTWQNHLLARMALPDSIDPNRLFQQTFQQHVRVMEHLPYGTLSRREQQIGELIVRESQQKVQQVLRLRSRNYEQKSEVKRQRWSWVNRSGGFLVHTAAVFLLACIFFFVARQVAGFLGVGALLSADSLVNQLLLVMLLLFSVGVVLLQFVPWGVHKLLRKQVELDNTLKLLSNS